ncbi:MAG: retroviral-like aspartic protease family protein, partial [bacterium]
MGETKVIIRVSLLRGEHKKPSEPIECIVDTGATVSTLPRKTLEKAGILPLGKVPVRLADGRIVEKEYSEAQIELDGISVPGIVLFGNENEPSLLGVTVLEMARFVVDPIENKIVKKEYY